METEYYKVMCLDYGDVRIGIALSDLTQTIANGYENYNRQGVDKDLKHLKTIVESNNVKKIVIGLPINMNGSDSAQTLKTRDFAKLLEDELKIKVDFLDERLSSMLVEKMLINASVSREKRKNVLDKLSATVLLQDYLNIKKGEL